MKCRPVLTIIAASATVAAAITPPLELASAISGSASGIVPLLRVGTNFSIPTLNPAKPGYSSYVTDLSLETLLKIVGPDNKLEPNLATSVSEPNPDTYIYHLRSGVKFWDGNAMTAVDVAFSLNYYRSPGSPAAYQFAGVKSIAADGPSTVVVTLSQPNAAWQYVPADVPGVFEMKFFQAHEATFGNPGTLIMGTGPWEVDSFDPTTGAELSANPNWWGGAVPIQHVSVKLFTEETSLALAMRAGEIDLDPYILDSKTFATTSGAKLESTNTCDLGVFEMNTQTPPWNDIHVRRAVAYALDRTNIIAAAGGYNSPTYTYIPRSAFLELASTSQVNSLFNSVPTYSYNLAAAKAQMAESAYPHGYNTVLNEYNYGSSVDISEVVAAELQKIGINAQVKVAPSLTAWEAIATGPAGKRITNFSTGWCPGPDISSYGFSLGSWNLAQGQWNGANWAPPSVDSLLKAGVATSDPAKRFTIYSRLLRILQTDLPYIGLYQEGTSIALSSKFTVPNYNVNSMSGAYALDVTAAG
jgi:peptide/nickel transport system substrate-binding protein